MTNIQDVSLKMLRPGQDYPAGSINPRKAGRTGDIEQLAAEIADKGLLQSLFGARAEKDDGFVYIGNGNRRLLALRALVKEKKIDADAMIPVLISDDTDPKKLLLASLSTAVVQNLHPVDQFEAFATELDQEGQTADTIAKRHALPLKVVKQRLALGKLSPVIRDAWRKGNLNADAAEAYASTPHHEAQEKLFKRGGWEAKTAHGIRQRLIGEQHEVQKLLKFVGEAEYKKAGGQLEEDLFGSKDGQKIANFGLLSTLTEKKLKALAAEFVAKGWGWTAIEDDLPDQAWHGWPRKSNPNAAEKKKLGVMVKLDYNGKVETRTGVIKPGVKGIEGSASNRSASKPPKKKKPGQLSNALAQRLSEQLTYAAGDAITATPDLALGLAIAALVSNGAYSSQRHGADSSVRLVESGLSAQRNERGKDKPMDFKTALAAVEKMKTPQRLGMVAAIVGKSLDFQTLDSERMPLDDAEVKMVIAGMNGAELNRKLRERFTPADYFKGINAAMRIEAISEMAPVHLPRMAKLKGKDQIAVCIAAYPTSPKWLPPALRTVHYDGPVAKKAAAKKKTAKAAPKRKRA